MYHPTRGGVRGGADQFDWENVKTDKHRENYLGHSLKAPVGRWQKGKDLLWYSKDRTANKEEAEKAHMAEMKGIKRAEEEAMLAALGHKVVKKEVQPLTKEEMGEVFKRSNGEKDSSNIERVEGVGISCSRASMLVNSAKQKRESEGDMINDPSINKDLQNSPRSHNVEDHHKGHRSKKSSKHHKKEKKHKKKKKSEKRHSYSENSDDSKDNRLSSKRHGHKHHSEHNRSSKSSQNSDSRAKCDFSKEETSEHKSKRRRHDSSSDSDSHLNVNSHRKGHEKYSDKRHF